eukprot:13382219-Ditylum_brightwellii.AAC.1
MKAANEWHYESIFETLGDECSREAKYGEVGASSRHSKKPVSSEEVTCNEFCQWQKELALEEDEEIRASSLHSKKPVSSRELTFKEQSQGQKELVLEEDGDVGASLQHSEKPVSSEEFTCEQH